jgi:phosphosulfolactate synthase
MHASDVNGFLNVPARSPKPREGGITHVLDKGMTLNGLDGLFETAGDYVDILKFGWGTAYVTSNLHEKVELCRSSGTPVVCGGTLFEAVVGLGKLDDYRRWLTDLGITHVEVSDGTITLERDEKLELIAELARDFVVLSEVGSKDEATVFAPYQWVAWMKEELEAGAWKVITEGREGGTAGIFRPNGDMRTGLIDEIVHEIDFGRIIFEAPTKASQAYFVKQFGPEVNLGNIPPDEVIPLETLRLGLRADTLQEVLLHEQPAAAE